MKIDLTKEIVIGKILDPKKAVKRLNLSGESHLNKSVLVENFLLLNTRSRNASMFFVQSSKEYQEAENLAKQLGLGFKVRTVSSIIPKRNFRLETMSYRAFTFINEEKSKEIDRLHITEPTSSLDLVTQFSPLTAKSLGSLLDYDFCCALTYAQDIGSLADPDERIFIQVNSYKDKKRKINLDSFYVEEVVPCKPDCGNAATKGRKYEQDLRTQVGDIVADIYRNLKSEHFKDIEEGRILERKKEGRERVGWF